MMIPKIKPKTIQQQQQKQRKGPRIAGPMMNVFVPHRTKHPTTSRQQQKINFKTPTTKNLVLGCHRVMCSCWLPSLSNFFDYCSRMFHQHHHYRHHYHHHSTITSSSLHYQLIIILMMLTQLSSICCSLVLSSSPSPSTLMVRVDNKNSTTTTTTTIAADNLPKQQDASKMNMVWTHHPSTTTTTNTTTTTTTTIHEPSNIINVVETSIQVPENKSNQNTTSVQTTTTKTMTTTSSSSETIDVYNNRNFNNNNNSNTETKIPTTPTTTSTIIMTLGSVNQEIKMIRPTTEALTSSVTKTSVSSQQQERLGQEELKLKQTKVADEPQSIQNNKMKTSPIKTTTAQLISNDSTMEEKIVQSRSKSSFDLVGRVACEYGTVRKYVINTIIQWRLSNSLILKSTLIVKCLNQITLATSTNMDELDVDKLNGQKYLAIISDFRLGPKRLFQTNDDEEVVDDGILFLDSTINDNNNNKNSRTIKKRTKRGLYRYIEHLWKDFKSMLTPESSSSSSQDATMARDDFDNDMIESMENEMENNRKCHYEMPNKYWENSPTNKYYLYYGASERCINCNQVNNPLSKMSLPFWFIKLEDGSIPQIRFCKQETNIEIKNWKKYLISLLITQLDSSSFSSAISEVMEKSWLGIHRSYYQIFENHNITNIDNNNMDISFSSWRNNRIKINKHIEIKELKPEKQQQQTLKIAKPIVMMTTIEKSNNIDELKLIERKNPLVNIESNQTYTLDKLQSAIVNLVGNASVRFDQENEIWTYLDAYCHYNLKMFQMKESPKHDDPLLKVLAERFIENTKETLVAQDNKRESILMEKYSKLLGWMRSKLGKNEYRYYTTLYESATSKLNSQEHDVLLELITLEQQLNHTVHQHNSIIGDIRRIGTAHNIQLVCGVNMVNIENEKCFAFIMLLLRSSSKTAQRDLLYALQNTNQSKLKDKEKISLLVARLLSQTNKPSRWFIENLLHETFHQTTSNERLEATLLQALTLLSQNEQLIKLKEMLSVHIVKRVLETLNTKTDSLPANKLNLNDELFLADLIKMLGNLDNYTAIQFIHRKLESCGRLQESTFLTIATIHAYRHSINRLQIQNYLAELFHKSSCQIKQEIVQLMIDNVDLIFLEQSIDKRWPKYSFNQLDQILAQNLRNSSNNCVHHLIVEYFRRKTNHKSLQYVKEFESTQNYDSSSFDFCINESNQIKCDYVQKVGTDMVSMSIRKSITTPRIWKNHTFSNANKNTSVKQLPPSGYYTKYSIDLTILKNKLTLGHLNVIQNSNSQCLHMEFDSYRGQTISIASLNISDLIGNEKIFNGTTNITQLKINIPEIIVWTKHYLHFDYSLLVHVNLLLELKFIPGQGMIMNQKNSLNTTKQQEDKHSRPQFIVKFEIKSSAEVWSTSLISKSSIELNSLFKYESLQPITDGKLSTDYQQQQLQQYDEDSSLDSSLQQYLGSEWFHHEIELFRDFNKRYDPQCNTWIDDSYRQTLSLWNSTLVQKNLLSLS